MKRLLLALTALSTIAACAAAARNPQTAMASAAVAQAAAESAPAAADLAGAPPAPALAPVHAARRISAPARMACDIRTTPTSRGVAISAVFNTDRAVSGDYNLVITKSGASGSSDVTQGGPFDAARGERVTLGETELGLDRGDRFHAVLTLTDADGRVCRQELRS